MADLFGPSKYAKNTDPALAEFSDDQLTAELKARQGWTLAEPAYRVPSWVSDEEIRRELETRKHNRQVTR